VLVPIYSPNYFTKSIYCGKEWQVFSDREQENRSSRKPVDVTMPEVILPILWTAPINYPSGVTALQNSHGADPAAYLSRGLGYMMRSPRKFGEQIQEFIDTFGRELARMTQTQGAAKMRNIADWDAIAPPFPENYRHGVGYVRYLFIAGRNDQMKTVRQRFDAYGQFENRRDWRPCFPDIDLQAGDLAHAVALENKKSYEFVEIADVNGLVDRLKEARDLQNIVVIVVDPWTLNVSDFDDFARKLDAVEFPTSAVIVVWNEHDPETLANLQPLQTRLSVHFAGRRGRLEYFQERVTSPTELRTALIAAFSSAQEKLLESGAVQTTTTNPGADSLPHVHT
jgi:FxsC-like protein